MQLCKLISSKQIELITSTWAHFKELRLKSVKWAQVEVISLIRLKATLLHNGCKSKQKMDFTQATLQAYIF